MMLDYRSGMPIFLAEDILICKFLLLHNLEAKLLQGKSIDNPKTMGSPTQHVTTIGSLLNIACFSEL